MTCDGSERFVFIIPSLMMCLAPDHLELRQHISETPVENILHEPGKSSVSVPAYDDDLVSAVDERPHVFTGDRKASADQA